MTDSMKRNNFGRRVAHAHNKKVLLQMGLNIETSAMCAYQQLFGLDE
ncbi:MAG: hypothetical protein WKG06_32715 [Segetibacter sp.]